MARLTDFQTDMIDIRGVRVYGIEESMIASGYPMHTNGMSVDEREVVERDEKRFKALGCAPLGSGHDNFLNGIVAQFDLTLPVQVWCELQRYHFVDFVSSGSKMHALTIDHLNASAFDPYVSKQTIEVLSKLQSKYLKNKTERNFYKLLMNCPLGYRLTARMTTNYRQLKTIYHQRKHHKLQHWREFCAWIEQLPMMEKVLCNE